MTRKIIWVSILFVLLMFGIGGCGDQGISDWNTIEKSGILLKIPTHWENDEQGSSTLFYTREGSAEKMVIHMGLRIYDQSDFEGENLNAVKEQLTATWISAFADKKPKSELVQVDGKEETKLTVNNITVLTDLSGTIQNEVSTAVYLYTASDHSLYFFTFPVQNDDDINTINKIIESIKFD